MTALLAQAHTSLPLTLYATLPFWPLLGAIGVGIWIAMKAPADKALCDSPPFIPARNRVAVPRPPSLDHARM